MAPPVRTSGVIPIRGYLIVSTPALRATAGLLHREDNGGHPDRAGGRLQSCDNAPYNSRSEPVNLK
jgi:hypothetical protein